MRGGERARVAERVRELLGVPDPEGPGPRFRWEPSRRAVLAVGVLVAVVGVLTALWWHAAESTPVPVPVAPAGSQLSTVPGRSTPPTTGTPTTSSAPVPMSSDADIVVDVDGKVVHPGLYRLPAGSRVYDALEAAGGVGHGVDTVSINLAAPVQDGQQIVVGVPGAAGPVGPGSWPATSAAALIDLNTATLDQLESLPGVGPVLSQKILDWRTEHGRFDSIDQLDEVSGVGPSTLAELTPRVTLG